MADREAIRLRLEQAFSAASLPLDPGDLADDVRLNELDGLDSVSRVRLTLAIEQTFSIMISARENAKTVTIGDLIALIGRKTGEADAG